MDTGWIVDEDGGMSHDGPEATSDSARRRCCAGRSDFRDDGCFGLVVICRAHRCGESGLNPPRRRVVLIPWWSKPQTLRLVMTLRTPCLLRTLAVTYKLPRAFSGTTA